ncbi:MAG: Ig domain-containing protein, partial [Xanthomonadaceae bacterium]|nr:Ig domain-containing protein [Xanthomonadaceae bacterium]
MSDPAIRASVASAAGMVLGWFLAAFRPRTRWRLQSRKQAACRYALFALLLAATSAHSQPPPSLDTLVLRNGVVALDYGGTDSGQCGTNLRLTSMGRMEGAPGVTYTIWRVRNSGTTARSITLEGVGSAFALRLEIRGRSEYLLRSPVATGAATHRLFEGATLIDTKAAGSNPWVDATPIPPLSGSNRPPVFLNTPGSLVVDVGQTWRHAAILFDPDNDAVALSAPTAPVGFTTVGSQLAFLASRAQIGRHDVGLRAEDGRGGSATQGFALQVALDFCPIYPIALPNATIGNAAAGTQFDNVPRGQNSGNFSWLSWNGANDAPTLAASLVPPGDSFRYINPDWSGDRVLSLGDWMQGAPGNMNAAAVRDAMAALIGREIVVPAWDQTRGRGAGFDYRNARFVRVQITAYQGNGQGTISFRYQGPATCYSSADELANERFALWAQDGAAADAFVWSGSENRVLDGAVHSNAGLRLDGSRNDFGGSVRWVSAFSGSGSGTENRFLRAPAQTSARSLPFAVDVAAYAPGGALAQALGASWHNQTARCVGGKWIINVPGATLAAGVHYVPCDVDISGSGLVANATIIATGRITLGGNTFRFSPFHRGIQFATSSTAPDAVRLSGSDSEIGGAVWAGNGGIELGTTRYTHRCPVRGQRIRLSASYNSFDVGACQLGSNTAPVITTSAPTTAAPGVAYAYDVDATDADNDSLTYALGSAPAAMTINAGSGLIAWTPAAAQVGANSVTVRVTDGRGGEALQTFTVTVAQANRPPVISSTAPTAATTGAAYAYDVDATDADNDSLTYALGSAPAAMTINAGSGL